MASMGLSDLWKSKTDQILCSAWWFSTIGTRGINLSEKKKILAFNLLDMVFFLKVVSVAFFPIPV